MLTTLRISTRIATRSAYSTKSSHNFSNREERPSRSRSASASNRNHFDAGIASTSKLIPEKSSFSPIGRQLSYEEASPDSFGRFDSQSVTNSRVERIRPRRVRRDPYANIPTEPTYPDGPNPSFSSLSPELISQLRLSLMNTTGRVPSQEEMQLAVPQWLRQMKRKEKAALLKAEEKLNLTEWKAAKLDEGWVWKRAREEEAGIIPSAEDLLEDERVEMRISIREAEGFSLKRKKSTVTMAPPNHLGLSPQEIQLAQLQHAMAKTQNYQRNPTKPAPIIESGPINPPAWLAHRMALQSDFPQGWAPPKRLSREAMELVRLLQRSDPAKYTTPILAARFKISPEAIRRILKSSFVLPPDEMEKREAQRKKEKLRLRDLAEEESSFKTSWAGDTVSEQDELSRLRGRDESKGISNEKRSRDVWPDSR